jgi:hypothetical protein
VYRTFSVLLFSFVVTHAVAQTAPPEPKTSIEWFLRASERMNLRMPGSAPFHMKVTFHAFPGIELLPPKKSEIVTGDGTYEETWLAPHTWRREVALAGYHAVEVESEKGRKMQASSDYEPSRVLMLLNALLAPIPRNFASQEFRHSGASGWTIDHLTKGDLSLVRISRGEGGGAGGDLTDAFYFLPHGLLAIRNEFGLETHWEDDSLFTGKVFARHITIKAGERELLNAQVGIENAGRTDPGAFDLPGDFAEPGMTLRPLQAFEVKMPDLSFSHSWVKPGYDTGKSVYSLREVLDRHGRYRESEVILLINAGDLETLMDLLRQDRYHAAEIDGSPCQIIFQIGGT